MRVEGERPVGAGPAEMFHFSVTVTFKKKVSHAGLTDGMRLSCAREFLQTVHSHCPALVDKGVVRLWTLSCERGTDPKYGRNLHVQGCVWFGSWRGLQTAIKALKAFLKACCPVRDNLVSTVYVEQQGLDQPDEDLVMYPEKEFEEGNDWYFNVHGGPDYPDEATHAEWWEAFQTRRSNVNGHGFNKSGFRAARGGKRILVNPNNYATLAISFAQFRGLDRFGASLLRRLGWMLQSGRYELAQSFVMGKYGSFTPRDRFEAHGALNEQPRSRGGDMALLALVFCGSASERMDASVKDIISCPPFMRCNNIEAYDLFDVECLRANGRPPARFVEFDPLSGAAVGYGVVVDLGFHEEKRPDGKATLQLLHEVLVWPTTKLYELNVLDPNGFFCVGLLDAVVESVVNDPRRSLQAHVPDFGRLTTHEVLLYNSGNHWRAVRGAVVVAAGPCVTAARPACPGSREAADDEHVSG